MIQENKFPVDKYKEYPNKEKVPELLCRWFMGTKARNKLSRAEMPVRAMQGWWKVMCSGKESEIGGRRGLENPATTPCLH